MSKDLELKKGENIRNYVSQVYGISTEEIKGKRRDRKYVLPRQLAIHHIRYNTDLTLKEIGSLFGDRDHSTIIHAADTIQDLEKYDYEFWVISEFTIEVVKRMKHK